MEVIAELQSCFPNAMIIVSSILPARDPALNTSSRWRKIPEFSAGLGEACRENNIAFVDNDAISQQYVSMWEPDGIHLRSEFYTHWMRNLIEAVLEAISMKAKESLYEFLRWTAVVVIVIHLASQLIGFPVRTDEIGQVESAVITQLDMSNMKPGDNQMVKRLYGLDPATFEGCILYYPTTNMGAEELLLIKLSDTAQQENVAAAVAARIENQKVSFDGYGIEQYDLLTNNAITEVRGNYALFVVSADCAKARQHFWMHCKEGLSWHLVILRSSLGYSQ